MMVSPQPPFNFAEEPDLLEREQVEEPTSPAPAG